MTGLVVRPDLGVSYRCAIRDQSPWGVRLKLPVGAVAPDTFWLIDVAEARAHQAIMIWRAYPEIGVALTDPIDLKAQRPVAVRNGSCRALWLEAAPRQGSVASMRRTSRSVNVTLD